MKFSRSDNDPCWPIDISPLLVKATTPGPVLWSRERFPDPTEIVPAFTMWVSLAISTEPDGAIVTDPRLSKPP